MRSFQTMNPAAAAVQILLAACITLFCLEPLLLGVSLLCGIGFFLVNNGAANRGFHIGALGLPTLFALLNPLWNQHGITVLFLINDRAYTLEALCYGAATGLRLAAVLYWFRAFSDIMNSEKLFYLFRFLSPKLALIFTAALRNITLFREQMRRIQRAQRAAGLYREGHLIDDIRGGLRVFSILLTWALENGIITAMSMSARGYGTCRRTSCTFYKWRSGDVILLLLSFVLAAGALIPAAYGALHREFYPVAVPPVHGAAYVTAVAAYAVLAMLPLIYAGKEALTWHCLRSEI